MEKRLIMSEHRLSQKAVICKHLLDGAPLMSVNRLYSGQYKWRFYCKETYPPCPTSVVTLGEVLERFPEIEPFLKRAYDCSVQFYRVEVGGRWHKEIIE